MVLDELLDDAPVTWARSYGGPLLPPMMLREPITDFPLDIPVRKQRSAWRLIRGGEPRLGGSAGRRSPGRELDSELGCGT